MSFQLLTNCVSCHFAVYTRPKNDGNRAQGSNIFRNCKILKGVAILIILLSARVFGQKFIILAFVCF